MELPAIDISDSVDISIPDAEAAIRRGPPRLSSPLSLLPPPSARAPASTNSPIAFACTPQPCLPRRLPRASHRRRHPFAAPVRGTASANGPAASAVPRLRLPNLGESQASGCESPAPSLPGGLPADWAFGFGPGAERQPAPPPAVVPRLSTSSAGRVTPASSLFPAARRTAGGHHHGAGGTRRHWEDAALRAAGDCGRAARARGPFPALLALSPSPVLSFSSLPCTQSCVKPMTGRRQNFPREAPRRVSAARRARAQGGLGGGCVYIDTESKLSATRLVEMASTRHPCSYGTEEARVSLRGLRVTAPRSYSQGIVAGTRRSGFKVPPKPASPPSHPAARARRRR